MADGAFNKLPKTAAGLHRAVSQAIRKTAFDIQADAASRAPVDTGFLRASIYTVTSRSSNYGKGRASKHGGKANVAKGIYQELLPEIEPPPDDLEAYVAVGASYGLYVEYGTVYMPAQPYFTPAAEDGQATLNYVLGLIAIQLDTDLDASVEVDEI